MLELRQISKFISVHGPVDNSEPVQEITLDYYSDILPDGLLRHWVEYGWGFYAKGLLQTVNPNDYSHILNSWLTDKAANAHAILRTAFGDIIFWQNSKAYYLDVLYNNVHEITDNLTLLFDYTLCNDKYLKKVVKENLYLEAVEAYGKLESSECFGFFPTLSMGGLCVVENIRKVKLNEHLELLRQIIK